MDKSTNDIRRQNWSSIIDQCQKRPADMSVRQWLSDNGIKEKAYYYWLRKFRREAYDAMQLPANRGNAEVSFVEIPVINEPVSVCSPVPVPSAVIRKKGLEIEISNSISGQLLSLLIKEAMNA